MVAYQKILQGPISLASLRKDFSRFSANIEVMVTVFVSHDSACMTGIFDVTHQSEIRSSHIIILNYCVNTYKLLIHSCMS